jgi:hypothetical protein
MASGPGQDLSRIILASVRLEQMLSCGKDMGQREQKKRDRPDWHKGPDRELETAMVLMGNTEEAKVRGSGEFVVGHR